MEELFGEPDCLCALVAVGLFFIMAKVYWINVSEVWRIYKRKIKKREQIIQKIKSFLIFFFLYRWVPDDIL